MEALTASLSCMHDHRLFIHGHLHQFIASVLLHSHGELQGWCTKGMDNSCLLIPASRAGTRQLTCVFLFSAAMCVVGAVLYPQLHECIEDDVYICFPLLPAF